MTMATASNKPRAVIMSAFLRLLPSLGITLPLLNKIAPANGSNHESSDMNISACYVLLLFKTEGFAVSSKTVGAAVSAAALAVAP
jgi:hypothetical protein